MRVLIEQMTDQMRQPISIAFALVRLGYFSDIAEALALVDSVVGNVPFGRN